MRLRLRFVDTAKWNEEKKNFFIAYTDKMKGLEDFSAASLENAFKELATEKNIKPGELQLPFRIMLVGGKFGPPVFDIAEILGREETAARISRAIQILATPAPSAGGE